ncbi:hypothetical protein AZ019_002773 [Klebsiella pneumoniae]|nr:hypothetical protein AZ019_002773 [Klebsiella pneumoniae]
MRLSRATCTMAEVPLPTPTQVPVPSTDIRNAVFAGAKLDEEVTGTGEFYTDRLGAKRLTNTGRNNQFDAAQLDRANRFEQFLLSSGYVFLGDYEDGPFQFSARNQYIRYNDQYYRLNATTDVGFTTTGTDAISFANDVAHFVLMDGDTLRQNLGSGEEEEGDALLAVKQPFPGSALRTQHDKNAEFVSITDFSGAVSGQGNDSTSAFVAAYATGLPVYVPYGDWFTQTYDRHLTYGPGRVFSNDSMFTDSGERITPPYPGNIRQFTTYHKTRGNFERAAGRAKIINAPNERVQVSGFSNPSQYATYANSDHVGDCVQMHAPGDYVTTTAASTTYTEFTITAPEIVAGANIEIGDFINTTHSPRYKGKVLAIDTDTQTLTVDGWYAAGNSSAGQVPSSGYSANINKADKIWARYDVVYIDQTGLTATGHEIGFSVSKQPGNPVWGHHVVNYSDTYYLTHGYRTTGKFNVGYYIGSDVVNGIQKDVTSASTGAALLVLDLTDSGWTGSVINLNTNFRKATSNLAQIRSGGVTHFSIDSRGVRNVQRESVAVVSSGTTITGLSPSIILFNSTTDIIITLSASNAVAGQLFEFRNVGSGTVTINTSTTLTNGQYAKFVFDGTSYILLIKV